MSEMDKKVSLEDLNDKFLQENIDLEEGLHHMLTHVMNCVELTKWEKKYKCQLRFCPLIKDILDHIKTCVNGLHCPRNLCSFYKKQVKVFNKTARRKFEVFGEEEQVYDPDSSVASLVLDDAEAIKQQQES